MSAGRPRSCRWSSGGAAAARSALERTIAAGGVAVFPSDGVYGLACDPLDPAAIARIHRIKGRDDGKPAAVMYFSPLAMRELVAELGPRAAAAVSALLPGPVTLVVKNPGHRYPLACREDVERLGVRLLAGPAGRGDVPDLPDLGQPQRQTRRRPLRGRPRLDPRRASTWRSTAAS